MWPIVNAKICAVAKACGLEPTTIRAGDDADVYVVPHEWKSYSSEAYRLGDVLCAVIEKLAPLLGVEDEGE